MKWDDIPSSSVTNAEHREEELKAVKWKEMVNGGSQTCRFMNTKESAWSIIDTVLRISPMQLHVIQRDLKRVCSQLSETTTPPKRRKGFFAVLFGIAMGSRRQAS